MPKNGLKKHWNLDPKNKIALTNLGPLQFGEGNIEEAWETVQSLQSSVLAVDTDAEVENLLGFILLAQRKTEDAAKHFTQATALNPRLAEPHLGLALTQMRDGNTEDAFKEMAKALLLEPQRAVFHSYWGKMLFQVKHFSKALNAFDRARSLDPNDPTSEYYKAILLRDLNRPGEAIQAFKNAVALNDNRAVYRSRFLLDQDLAIRNTKLSGLYSELGLDAWARNKALASVKYDYTNFDSHLFYAGSLSHAGDRSYSFTSEALLARLLQPANVNTFNNFNNYTAQFEQPKVEGTITRLIGNNSTYGGSGELFGALPAANAAFSLGGFYQDSDRWRDSNFEPLRSAVAIGKWQPTLNDGFLAGVTQTKIKQGDAIYPRFEYDSPAQPDNRFEGNVQRYEFGYHRHLAPKSDLLLYVTYLKVHRHLPKRAA